MSAGVNTSTFERYFTDPDHRIITPDPITDADQELYQQLDRDLRQNPQFCREVQNLQLDPSTIHYEIKRHGDQIGICLLRDPRDPGVWFAADELLLTTLKRFCNFSEPEHQKPVPASGPTSTPAHQEPVPAPVSSPESLRPATPPAIQPQPRPAHRSRPLTLDEPASVSQPDPGSLPVQPQRFYPSRPLMLELPPEPAPVRNISAPLMAPVPIPTSPAVSRRRPSLPSSGQYIYPGSKLPAPQAYPHSIAPLHAKRPTQYSSRQAHPGGAPRILAYPAHGDRHRSKSVRFRTPGHLHSHIDGSQALQEELFSSVRDMMDAQRREFGQALETLESRAEERHHWMSQEMHEQLAALPRQMEQVYQQLQGLLVERDRVQSAHLDDLQKANRAVFEQLQSQIAQNLEQIRISQQAIQQFRDQLTSQPGAQIDSRLQVIERQLAQFNGLNARLDTLSDSQGKMNEDLRANAEALHQTLEQLQQFGERVADKEHLQHEVDSLAQILRERERLILQMQSRLDLLSDQKEREIAELRTSVREDLDRAAHRLGQAQDEVEALAQQLHHLKSQQKKLQGLSTANARLRVEIQERDQAIATSTERQATVIEELARLQERLRSLEHTIEDGHSQKEDELQQLRLEASEQARQLSAAHAEKETLRQQAFKLSAENEELTQNIHAATEARQALERQDQDIQSQLTSLREELGRATAELQAARFLNTEKDRLAAENQKLAASNDQKQACIAQLEEETRRLAGELDQRHVQEESFAEANRRLQSEAQKAQARIESMAREFQETLDQSDARHIDQLRELEKRLEETSQAEIRQRQLWENRQDQATQFPEPALARSPSPVPEAPPPLPEAHPQAPVVLDQNVRRYVNYLTALKNTLKQSEQTTLSDLWKRDYGLAQTPTARQRTEIASFLLKYPKFTSITAETLPLITVFMNELTKELSTLDTMPIPAEFQDMNPEQLRTMKEERRSLTVACFWHCIMTHEFIASARVLGDFRQRVHELIESFQYDRGAQNYTKQQTPRIAQEKDLTVSCRTFMLELVKMHALIERFKANGEWKKVPEKNWLQTFDTFLQQNFGIITTILEHMSAPVSTQRT